MFEFEVIQEIKPNTDILEIIKNCTFTTKNGKVKHLLKTNLQFIEPTEYLITECDILVIGNLNRNPIKMPQCVCTWGIFINLLS